MLVANSQRAARVGATVALGAHGFEVVAECATADAAVANAREYRPDVCVLDGGLAGEGFGGVSRLRALNPAPRVVLLAESATVADVVAALDAGASGFLLRSVTCERLAIDVADVAAGELVLAPAITAAFVTVVRALRATRPNASRPALTQREGEVLALLATGLTTKEVAQQLGLSPTTIRRHVSTAATRLGVSDRRAVIEGAQGVQGRERE